MLGMGDISLTNADLNHYIKNPLTIFQSESDEVIRRGTRRLADFIADVERSEKFPSVYLRD